MKKTRLMAFPVTALAGGICMAMALSGCNSSTTSTSSSNPNNSPNNIDQLTVNYDEQQHTYALSWQASDPQQSVTIAVASADAPDTFRTLTDNWQASSYQWKADGGEQRRYFKVVPKNGQAAESAARWLPLEGGRNFRDLGGYMTKDGQQVRWGKLFRTGAMSGLTDQDYKVLSSFDIATVVDFRTPQERESEPTRWQNPSTDILSWDYDMDMGANGAFAQVFRQPDLSAAKVEGAMASMYPDLVETQKPHYQAMFERLVKNDDGLVFNCTAGKDRTGIAGALILTALGVDEETVVQDFMLSDVYYQQHPMTFSAPHGEDVDAKQQAMMAMFMQLPPEILQPIMGVKESYIRAAFDSMEQQSGSVMAYIQQELKVDDQALQKLRQNFLQQPQS